MRDPNRLYKFYNELMRIHMEKFPDWRFGQFIGNFEAWLLMNSRDIDGMFYIEEEEFLKLLNEYAKK